ncbi:hypothetical protein KI688_000911 [Linnemannia hyalina]|uniref:Uncharacterized protein n=1 Tax=Linnemannia hyalina TaxID=64524 RepID=A0A9P7Y751_9FUNG|nr:hypothetical protein KI688_000911 [Linnemannia hyalina]
MDPHAQVQGEFNQYSEQRNQEQLLDQVVNRNNFGIVYVPHANLFSSSSSTEPASVIPVTTITDAPIAGAPMVATAIPTGDISAAAVVPPGQIPDTSGGDCFG